MKSFNSRLNSLILLLVFPAIILSQQSLSYDSITTSEKIVNDFNLSLNNNLNYFSHPSEFQTSDWLMFSGIVVSSGLLMTIDDEVRKGVRANQTNFQNDFSKIGKYYGEFYSLFGIPLSIYGSGLLFKSEELRTTGRILIESLIAAGITTTAIKVIAGRGRPKKNKGEFDFNFFEIKNINASLPSGHSTVAFTISTVLSERIDNIYASIALYGLASLTAYQRVYSNNHWPSDTFLAAAIGITAGKFFSNLEVGKEEKIQNKFSYKILPNINSSNVGFLIQIQF
ncbi:MAG: phosphatase PAP2 family protein [Melioribacteraceae bacterium]